MTDQRALDEAVRLYLPWVRRLGILQEETMTTALIRTRYWRIVRDNQPHAEVEPLPEG